MFEIKRQFYQDNKIFLALLTLSIVVHVAILSQINWKSKPRQQKSTTIEVDLFQIKPPPVKTKPLPKIIPPKKTIKKDYKSAIQKNQASKAVKSIKPHSTTEPQTAKPPEVVVTKKPVVRKPSLSVQSQLTHIEKQSTQENKLKLSQKSLSVPRVKTKPSTGNILPMTPEKKDTPLDLTKANVKTNDAAPQVQNVKVEQLIKTDITGEAKAQAFVDDGKTDVIKQGNKTGETGSEKLETGFKQGQKIEGEISKRKVIYKPEAPQLNIDRDVTVILKFTVLPNGEVDQVFPYQKAEPELERVAIEMLHHYRFEPLFGSTAVQNGIIHFTVFRKK